MASRLIEIRIDGNSAGYEASIQRITEKTARLNRDSIAAAQRTTQQFGALQSVLINLHSSVLPAVGRAFALALPIGALAAFFTSALKGAADLHSLSEQTGILATNLQALQQAGIATGQGIDDAARSIINLQSKLIEARDKGTGPVAEALKRLGVTSGELGEALVDPNRLLEILSQKLAGVTNVAERNAIAMDLVGKSGGRTALTLIDLANNQEKYRQSAVLTNEQAKILDDGLGKLGQEWQALKNNIAATTVEFAKFLGLIERSRGEALSRQIGDIDTQLSMLRKQFEQFDKIGIQNLPPTLQGSLRENIARRQELLAERERLQASLNAESKQPTPAAAPRVTIDPDIIKKQNDAIAQATHQLLQLRLANAEAANSAGDLTEKVRNLAEALITQEQSAAIAAARASGTLTPQLKALIDLQAEEKIKKLDLAKADAERKEKLAELTKEINAQKQAEAQLGEVLEANDRAQKELNQQALEAIEITRQLGEAEAERLLILGQTSEAEKIRLQTTIEYLRQRRELEAATPGGKDTRVLEKQIENAETALKKLGNVSIDIGRHVGNTLEDIFTGMINGTLKGVDILKAATGTVGRIVTDIFSQVIKNKLAFELKLFNNVRGLPGQLNSAAQSGAQGSGGGLFSGLFGAGGGGGSLGGLFGGLFGGSGRPPGVEGPLLPNGNFVSGGGGGILGGLLDGVGSLLGSLGGGINSFFGLTGGTGSLFGPAGALSGLADSLSGLSSAIPYIGALFSLFKLGGAVAAGDGAVIASTVAQTVLYALSPYTFGITAVLGFLLSLFGPKGKPPTSRASLTTQFEGLKLGDAGLEVGNITTSFTAKGLATKGLGDIGGQAEESVLNTLQSAVAVMNKLPRAILKILDLDSITSAIEAAGSFSIKVRDIKFAKVLNENLVSIPAKVLNATGPLFVAGIEEQLKLFGGKTEGVGDFVKRILPPTGIPGPNEALIKMTEDSLSAFGNFFDFLNQLEAARKFASAPEQQALTGGVEGLLSAKGPKELEAGIEKYKEVFSGIFQSIQSRQRIAADIGSAIIEGVNGVDAATAFQKFTRGFSDVITETIQASIVESFVAEQVRPLLTGPVARIQEIFQGLGTTSGPSDFLAAQTSAQGEIGLLGGQLAALQPVFLAFRDVVNSITSQVQTSLGVTNPSAPGGGGNVVTVNVFGIEDVGEFARKLEEFLSGGTSPGTLQ